MTMTTLWPCLKDQTVRSEVHKEDPNEERSEPDPNVDHKQDLHEVNVKTTEGSEDLVLLTDEAEVQTFKEVQQTEVQIDQEVKEGREMVDVYVEELVLQPVNLHTDLELHKGRRKWKWKSMTTLTGKINPEMQITPTKGGHYHQEEDNCHAKGREISLMDQMTMKCYKQLQVQISTNTNL